MVKFSLLPSCDDGSSSRCFQRNRGHAFMVLGFALIGREVRASHQLEPISIADSVGNATAPTRLVPVGLEGRFNKHFWGMRSAKCSVLLIALEEHKDSALQRASPTPLKIKWIKCGGVNATNAAPLWTLQVGEAVAALSEPYRRPETTATAPLASVWLVPWMATGEPSERPPRPARVRLPLWKRRAPSGNPRHVCARKDTRHALEPPRLL